MGLPKAAVNLLLNESLERPFSGSIATLGRQHVYISGAEFQALASLAGVSPVPVEAQLHREPRLRACGYLSDDSLYQMLGFSRSVRIDQSAYEAAEEHLNLNAEETPAALCDAFDVVLDSGTIEHVFNIGQAMSHCLKMTRPGGRIIHLTPTSNAVNHGFYSVSPTLYADFYTAAGCTVEKLWLCQMPRHFERGTWRVYDCRQSDRNWLPLGRLDGSIWFTFTVIRKGIAAEPAVPTQAYYVATWGDDENKISQSSGQMEDEPADTRAGQLLRWTSSLPKVRGIAWGLIKRWRTVVEWCRERRRGRVPFPFFGTF